MNRTLLSIAAFLILASCGTPREQCIRNATSKTRTLDQLIAKSQANLSRGYRYETQNRQRFEWIICDSYRHGKGPRMCFEPVADSVEVPVAIDPAAEQRTLANLIERRAVLQQRAKAAVAACLATYPE
ncbi:MAG: hypothetical protein WBC90_19195 [Albidovulum sp.]